jgi:hypothetical protein
MLSVPFFLGVIMLGVILLNVVAPA